MPTALGRARRYHGPAHDRPENHEDDPFPTHDRAGEEAAPHDLRARLPLPFPPPRLDRELGALRAATQYLNLGDTEARDVLKGLEIVGFRKGTFTNVVLRWTVGSERTKGDGKVVTTEDGFVPLPHADLTVLLDLLRKEAAQPQTDEEIWREHGLAEDQVATQIAELLKANGLDAASLARKREAALAQRRLPLEPPTT